MATEPIIWEYLGVSCQEFEFPNSEYGSCTLAWDFVLLSDADGDSFELVSESNLAGLLVEVREDSITINGWTNTETPASLPAEVIAPYFEFDTKRYRFPLALRFYNADSKARGQQQQLFKVDIVFDPQDPLNCEQIFNEDVDDVKSQIFLPLDDSQLYSGVVKWAYTKR